MDTWQSREDMMKLKRRQRNQRLRSWNGLSPSGPNAANLVGKMVARYTINVHNNGPVEQINFVSDENCPVYSHQERRHQRGNHSGQLLQRVRTRQTGVSPNLRIVRMSKMDITGMDTLPGVQMHRQEHWFPDQRCFLQCCKQVSDRYPCSGFIVRDNFSFSTLDDKYCETVLRPRSSQNCFNRRCRGIWKAGEWSEVRHTQ